MRTRGVPRIHLVKVGAVASLPHGKRGLGAARGCRWPCDLHPARALGCGSGSRSHGLSKASLERELVMRRSRDRPLRSRYGRSRNSPRCTNGSEDRRSSAAAAMETILAAHWKTSSRAAMSEDDARTLRANSNALGCQTKYWRLIMQYGKSQEAIDRLTAEQRAVSLRRRAPNARLPGNTTITRSPASTWTSSQRRGSSG